MQPPDQTVLLDDEYIAWLLLVNAGMQDDGNLHLFDLAIRTAPEAPMLEIGSFCGLSTNITQYIKRKHGRTTPLFICDKWIFEGSEKELPEAAPASHDDLRDYAKETFERSVRALSNELPFTVEATSDEFFRAWADRQTVTDVFGLPELRRASGSRRPDPVRRLSGQLGVGGDPGHRSHHAGRPVRAGRPEPQLPRAQERLRSARPLRRQRSQAGSPVLRPRRQLYGPISPELLPAALDAREAAS